jgi:hypothetical protein
VDGWVSSKQPAGSAAGAEAPPADDRGSSPPAAADGTPVGGPGTYPSATAEGTTAGGRRSATAVSESLTVSADEANGS